MVFSTTECASHEVKIFIAGPIQVAEQIIRHECITIGLCVTINPTKYIYTMGEEVGYVVGLINYARFPSTPEEIDERAIKLAEKLILCTHQGSATVQTPTRSIFISRRKDT